MKKNIIFIVFLILSLSFVYSQDVGLLNFKIFNMTNNKPVPFVEICLFDNDTIIDSIMSNYDGNITIVVNSQKTDNLYLKIKNNNYSDTTKIFVKDLPILNYFYFSSYKIILFEYKSFTFKEYEVFCKKNKRLPHGKNIHAKNVE